METTSHSLADLARTLALHHSLIGFCVAVAFGCFVSLASADEFHVNPNGDDTRSVAEARQPETPWQTIQKGVDSIAPGDTLIVDDGTYSEHVRFTSGGREGESVRIIARNRHAAIIDGSIGGSGVDHILISGFDITNVVENNDETKGVAFYGCHHIKIVDNRVHDCRGGGICIDQSDWILIKSNITSGNAGQNPDQHSGISVYQPRPSDESRGDEWGIVIINNVSYHNANQVPNANGDLTDGNGIILDDYLNTQTDDERWNGQAYPRRTIVAGNICYGNGGRGIHCYLANDVYVQNNSTRGNMSNLEIGGEIAAVESQRIRITNNIMMPRSEKNSGMQFDSTAFWDFNLIAPGGNDPASSGVNHGAASLFDDPQFETDTFRILSDSPAVDAGTDQVLDPGTDFFGNPRVTGLAVDIGAAEHGE